jgi:hypothetical protein
MCSARIDWEGTQELRSTVVKLLKRFPDTDTFFDSLVDRFADLCARTNCSCPAASVCQPFMHVTRRLYEDEGFASPPPPFSPSLIGTMEGARYRDQLLVLHRKASNPQNTLGALHWTLINSFLGLIQHLPPLAFLEAANGTTTIPLLDSIDVPQAIEDISRPFLNADLSTLGICAGIRTQLERNRLEASNNNPKKLLSPREFKGSPREVVKAFLRDTPLEDFFEVRLPFTIPDEVRFEHTHIVGGSGAGKTTLIQQMVLDELGKPDPPAMVIIDPKGMLVERIGKLKVFDPRNGRLKKRLIIVDPMRTPRPALNMFHAAATRNRMQSDSTRRQVENQAISNFAYIFSSVGSKLTDKQSVPFTFLVRLLFSMPSANILTLMELLDDPADSAGRSRFAEHIGRMDAISRAFFENEYYDRNFSSTRKEIKARLYSLLMRPEFVEMFSTPERKLDLFDCLQSGKIVLVNTAMSTLGSEGSQLFGRYLIALTLNAAFERASVQPDPEKWKTAHLIIDEFQEFADDLKTPEMLRLAREYKLGITIAHQQMHGGSITESVRNTISTNTSIKYAAAVEGQDLAYVARDLRCEPSFLTGQRKSVAHAQFACFVRNVTDHAVSISVPLGNIGSDQQMSDKLFNQVRERNAALLHAVPPPTSSQVEPIPAPEAVAPSPGRREAASDPDTGRHTDPASKW